MQSGPILVIGPTGKTGRRVVDRLAAQHRQIRLGGRASPVPFDWDQPETWPQALQGVSAAFVTYYPDLAFPGAEEKIFALTEQAKKANVGRLVLLSGRGETHALRCEEIVRRSGVDFTLVRCAWFAQNFSEGYLHEAVMNGVVAAPAGDVREPIVDVDDIADVAVAALTEDRHAGELYEITGPRLMHFSEIASELGRAAGREIVYAPITLEQFHAAMTEIGGAFIADVFTHVCREALDGRNESLGDGVQRALGRPPRDFVEYCRTAAATGVWNIAT
ncbi:MAG: NAD(P)H-binding protein [Neomegalonema sp.]|nr:NAD(P)H-binding protein [Neomegalonema sp.]